MKRAKIQKDQKRAKQIKSYKDFSERSLERLRQRALRQEDKPH